MNDILIGKLEELLRGPFRSEDSDGEMYNRGKYNGISSAIEVAKKYCPSDISVIGDLTHTMNCAGNKPLNEYECTCGLKWRIMLQTEQTMHNAWRKRAEEAEALLNKREIVAGWQPIDTAPMDGTYVLICEPPYTEDYVQSARFHHSRCDNDPLWQNSGGIYLRPTHWMPLPMTPINSTEDGK